jgi:ATP-binding cassette subfamily F protein 3
MPVATTSNLSKSFGPQDVLEGISLDVPEGCKIALVGPNGCGKTTLLRIIAGLDTPTGGTIHVARNRVIGYLPQQPDFSANGTLWDSMLPVFTSVRMQAATLRQLELAMENPSSRDSAVQEYGQALEAFELAGGYAFENRIEQVLSGLGFDKEEFNTSVDHLSGGQKTRALLARLLLESPDLLLLDEPTNHLDLRGIEWLEGYLQTLKAAVVVVAHDRAFLDAIVDRVWDLTGGRLTRYRGDYTHFVNQKSERLRRQQVQSRQQERRRSETEEYIRRNMAGRNTRQAQGRQKLLQRLDRPERPEAHKRLHLRLDAGGRSGDLVLGLYDLVIGYSRDNPLFSTGILELRRGQRVALVGPNGTGKTTLARTILGLIPPLAGHARIGASVRSGHFAQAHDDLDLDVTVLDSILDSSRLTVSAARNLLARYGFGGDDVFKRIADLSGGERARVALARLALNKANLLLLDEPTNHLDLHSQDILQDVLADFGGTWLLVSHDRYLINALTSIVWAVHDRRLWEFAGGYQEYQEWMHSMTRSAEGESTVRPVSALEREARKVQAREEARRTRRKAELEDRIGQLEQRLAELGHVLAAASTQRAVDKVRRLGHEYTQIEAERDALLTTWAEVAG